MPSFDPTPHRAPEGARQTPRTRRVRLPDRLTAADLAALELLSVQPAAAAEMREVAPGMWQARPAAADRTAPADHVGTPAAPLNPPTSALAAPGSPPDDFAALPPYAVARMCERAGLPELTAGLLQMPVTQRQVQNRLEEAQAVMKAGADLGLAQMGRELALTGLGIEMVRRRLFAAKAEADELIVTSPTIPFGPPTERAAKAVDAQAAYVRLTTPTGKP